LARVDESKTLLSFKGEESLKNKELKETHTGIEGEGKTSQLKYDEKSFPPLV
jgi:hypothetical protein